MKSLKSRIARLEQQLQVDDADSDLMTLEEWRGLREPGGALYGLEGEEKDRAHDAYMIEHHPKSWLPHREMFLKLWAQAREVMEIFADELEEEQEIRYGQHNR